VIVFQTLKGEMAAMAYVCFIVSAGLHHVNVPLGLFFLQPVSRWQDLQQVAGIADKEVPLAERENEHDGGQDKAQSASLHPCACARPPDSIFKPESAWLRIPMM
jgi:hypothetical protein